MKKPLSFVIICILSVIQIFSQINFDGKAIHGILVGISDYTSVNAAPMQATIAPESYANINQEATLFPFFLGKKMVAAKDFIPIHTPDWVNGKGISEISVELHKYSENKVNPKILDQNTYFFNEKGQLLRQMAIDTQDVIQYSYSGDELSQFEIKSRTVNTRINYTYQYNTEGFVSHFEKSIIQTRKGLLVLSFQPGLYAYDIAYNEKGVPIDIYMKKDSKTELFRSVRNYSGDRLLSEDVCSRIYQNVWHNDDTFDSIMCTPRYVYSYNDQGDKVKEVLHYPIFVSGVGFVYRNKPVATSDFIPQENGFVKCITKGETFMGGVLETKYRYDAHGNLLEYNKGELEGTYENRLIQNFDNDQRIVGKKYFLNGLLSYAYIYQYDNEGKITMILCYGKESKRYDKVYTFTYKESLTGSLH